MSRQSHRKRVILASAGLAGIIILFSVANWYRTQRITEGAQEIARVFFERLKAGQVEAARQLLASQAHIADGEGFFRGSYETHSWEQVQWDAPDRRSAVLGYKVVGRPGNDRNVDLHLSLAHGRWLIDRVEVRFFQDRSDKALAEKYVLLLNSGQFGGAAALTQDMDRGDRRRAEDCVSRKPKGTWPLVGAQNVHFECLLGRPCRLPPSKSLFHFRGKAGSHKKLLTVSVRNRNDRRWIDGVQIR